MSHSKTKFSATWLKKKDGNGHLLEWWCCEHSTDRFIAVCRLCEKDINISNSGCHALLQHAGYKSHKEKAMVRYSSVESKLLKAKEVNEQSKSTSVGGDEPKPQEGTKQASIKEFFVKKGKDVCSSDTVVEPCSSKDVENVLTVQDQIVKAETLWALKTASENFSFRVSDGVPELFQKMFPDSTVAKHITMSRTKVAYMIGHGLGPYFKREIVDDIQRFPSTYFTIQFDETTNAQMKKQMDILVRYYSEKYGEVKVRFLKALMFGHAFAKTVSDEIWRTLQESGLSPGLLLSLSSDGPNVNKSIKKSINDKLQTQFKRQLVDTGSCQMHVAHNAFRKGIEVYGEAVENLCIDLFYFFKLSASRREDYLAIQQKLDLDEIVFNRHVESRWLSLLPAIEKVKSQMPALQEYFKKLPDADKKVKSNERYKRIMTILTSPETTVQLCFLKSIKPVFDRFLQMFQTEGPLIHVLHEAMLCLLKQVMSRFLKQCVIQDKPVSELLKVDVKNVVVQLKDSEIDIGDETQKAINDLKHSGKQRQCFLGIRSFFSAVVEYMQKSLELKNPLLEALSCLQPEQRTKASSVDKIRIVGSQLPSANPEELTSLKDEWRIYAETDIPEEWIQKVDKSVVRVDHYWHKVLQLKTPLGKDKFSVLAKVVKCALSLSHGNADSERSLSLNKKTLTKERSSLSITSVNGLRATQDGVKSMSGLSNITVTKEMLSCVKDSHKAYLEYSQAEKQKELKKRPATAEAEEIKKRQKEESRKLEELKSSMKDLDERESKAEQGLQKASEFLNEGNQRMTKGREKNDMDEIEAAEKIIQLAQEKQQKAKEELQNVHCEKRKLTEELLEKASKKLKSK